MLKLFKKFVYPPIPYSVGLILLLLTFNCSPQNKKAAFGYGTQNDSSRYYFEKGWQEIMDNGRWAESEIAFRKASELDPDWLLAKSLVGRITRDLTERQQILSDLQSTKDRAEDSEAQLLEVNLLSLIAANNRDQGIANAPEFNKERWQLAEKNFGDFAKKHPEDTYFKAEYIELLHLNHGAQTALDSLRILATPEQREMGFYLGYEGALELELGHIAEAIGVLEKLKSKTTDPSFNTPLILQAQILKKQDSIEKAKNIIAQVLTNDPNHLIALGMQNELKLLSESND